MAMDTTAELRKFRMISGPVERIEAWVNDYWEIYVIQNFTYQIIDNTPWVTVHAVLLTEVEKMARRMQLASAAQNQFQRRQ
jgi:hypothetical protein